MFRRGLRHSLGFWNHDHRWTFIFWRGQRGSMYWLLRGDWNLRVNYPYDLRQKQWFPYLYRYYNSIKQFKLLLNLVFFLFSKPIDIGAASTDTAKLAFTFSGASTVRTWDIKASQIPCAANYRPPGKSSTYIAKNTKIQDSRYNYKINWDYINLHVYLPLAGCLQHHTGLTGRFTTFNFLETTTPQHLASQE